MKKLRFVIFVILIIVSLNLQLFAVTEGASLTISGKVLPQVKMSISEQINSRNVEALNGTRNSQVFILNKSGNIGNSYTLVVKSKNAVQNQTEYPFYTNQNDEKVDSDYAIYFNGQYLEFSSGQATAVFNTEQTYSNYQSNLEIAGIEHIVGVFIFF